jgi:hypothetical protein
VNENTNWHIILLRIKITYPVEFCLAVSRFVVILGSKIVKATIEEINTKIDVKNNVMTAWNMCHPSQQIMSGKLSIT